MGVGEQIRMLRQTAMLSQQELALMLNVNQQSISQWERGEVQPADNIIERVKEAIARENPKPKTKPMRKPKPQPRDTSWCKPCVYWHGLGDYRYCDYYDQTKKIRPCAGGNGCTERVLKK